MSSKKKNQSCYFKYIDFIRLFACLAILLYHFGILRGGYLAVCTFFVLSGFLSTSSLFNKKKVSLKEYYFSKLFRLYLPLMIVVFISIAATFILDKTWLNLKPESTSIALGYNNYWQLSSSNDYFAGTLNSPFTHLWYIAILLQFDLIFPFIFMFLKKIGDRFNKIIPTIIISIFTLASTIYFWVSGINNSLMFTYYSTLTRIFSLLFGVLIGFIYYYYGDMIFKRFKNNISNKIIFFGYILILLGLFIFIDYNSNLFLFSMILVTLISARVIQYGSSIKDKRISIFDKVIKSLSSVSYEIYLVQYPIIYLFQSLELNIYLKYSIMFLLIGILSYLLHFCIFYKKEKYKIIRYITSFIVLVISVYGVYIYYISKDYTDEMNVLREQMNNNEKLISNNKETYLLNKEKEDSDWNKVLEELNNNENNLSDIVTNLPIVGIGDSVLLGAVPNLYDTFPKGYFDGKVSRTAWELNDILIYLKNNDILGNPIVLNLGTNGDCSYQCKVDILNTCEDRDVFWINTVNYTDVNERLVNLSKEYSNLHIIDWYSISKGHSEYFAYDGIHLTSIGREVYTKSIYDSIYNLYLEKYKKEKENIINKHNDDINKKVTFYGNDLLINSFEDIKDDFSDSNFITFKDISFNDLITSIKIDIDNDSINHKLVFVFDNSSKLGIKEYKELIKLCNNYNIYIVSLNSKINSSNFTNDNVKVIDFYKKINNNDYLMPDKVHLNNNGNKALSTILNDIVNN